MYFKGAGIHELKMAQRVPRGRGTKSAGSSVESSCGPSTSGGSTSEGARVTAIDPATASSQRLTLVNAAGGGTSRSPMRSITCPLPKGTKDTILVS